MLKFNRIYLFLTMLAVWQVGLASAQTTPQGGTVKWVGVSGKNDEFVVFLPEGYITTADSEYYLGKQPAPRVEKHLKAARYLNGVVLIMEYYEGKGKEIYKILKEREKATFVKEEEVNGFQIGHFSTKTEKGIRKTHIYFNDKSVYFVRGYAKSEDDSILKGFFESVRLINQKNVVAPNVPADAKSTLVPRIIERETPRLDDSLAIEPKEADRPLIILKAERPRFSSEACRGINNLRVKLRVLYSSSGSVANVEVLQVTSKLIEKEAVEAAKKVVFIPAEKDGKLVSVFQTVEYSFESRVGL